MRFPTATFPPATRTGITGFWVVYWLRFFIFLPFMLARQAWLSAYDAVAGWWTGNRTYRLAEGVELTYLSSWQVLPTTAIFGERFTAVRFRDTLIDPGPVFARRAVLGALAAGPAIARVVATHFHEEHIGNAAVVAARLGAPILGTPLTLREIGRPQPLSPGRRMLMGQPEDAPDARCEPIGASIVAGGGTLEVVPSPGHCEGHVALFHRGSGLLIAGDSFLHQIFTAPNGDVSSAPWMETLERFAALDVRTLIGAHGFVHTSDPSVPRIPFVVKRQDPNGLIRAKLEFLRWAAATVAEGERRGLPYSVIEACLFPWDRSWSWSTWFHDESFC